MSAPYFCEDLLRRDDVAEGLGHLAALAVDDETVRDDAGVGRVAVERDRGQKGRLEPAAVLVVPLDVEVGRELPRSLFESSGHSPERRTAMCETPESNQTSRMSVSFWKSAGEAAAGRRPAAGSPRRGARTRRRPPPSRKIPATCSKKRRCSSGESLPGIDLAPLAVAHRVEERDRRAPAPLAGDDPLAAVLDHPARCAASPHAGIQLHAGDRLQRAAPRRRSRIVQPHEPLDRRAEDDGVLAAPAVRVLVAELRGRRGRGRRRPSGPRRSRRWRRAPSARDTSPRS